MSVRKQLPGTIICKRRHQIILTSILVKYFFSDYDIAFLNKASPWTKNELKNIQKKETKVIRKNPKKRTGENKTVYENNKNLFERIKKSFKKTLLLEPIKTRNLT